MRQFALAAVAVALLGGADAPKGDKAKEELAAFQGTWTISKLERDGADGLPKDATIEVVFKGTEFSSPNIRATFTFDRDKTPKTMDISYKEGPAAGRTIKAIYKLEGESLTICRARGENDDRPGEFAAPAGSGKILLVLKKPSAK